MKRLSVVFAVLAVLAAGVLVVAVRNGGKPVAAGDSVRAEGPETTTNAVASAVSASEPKAAVQSKPSDPDDPVIVRIEGQDVTRREIVAGAKAVLTLNMNKARRRKIGMAEKKAMQHYCDSDVSRRIARAALHKYAQEKGIAASPEMVQSVTRTFERRFGVYSRKLKRWHNVQDLRNMLGKEAFRVDEELNAMLTYCAVTNQILSAAKIEVTDQEVQQRLADIAAGNRRMAETNRLVYARATNVWKKVVSKDLTFEAAAERYSEDINLKFGCEWGTFTQDQLSDEEALLPLLPQLKVGDITPPIAADSGVAILRRDANDNPTHYAFSWIFFRLPMFFEEETPEQARAAIYASRCNECVRETVDRVRNTLRVEYPDGTNGVGKVTAQDFNRK